MPLEAVYQCLSKNELFRLSWGAKNAHGDDWKKLQQQYEDRLQIMIKEAEKEGWLKPQGMYGYWPCQSNGTELIIYQPASVRNGKPLEISRFSFPRQSSVTSFVWQIILHLLKAERWTWLPSRLSPSAGSHRSV
jgi:5-methyltetrahydrofolate--homocysteine methyltransferase